MTACLILVKYSFNIAKILQRIVPTSKEISLTNLGTILGWYSLHINWLNIWNTPLSDIGMMSEYNRYILANICAMFHIGSILVQYCTNMAVLLGLLTYLLKACLFHIWVLANRRNISITARRCCDVFVISAPDTKLQTYLLTLFLTYLLTYWPRFDHAYRHSYMRYWQLITDDDEDDDDEYPPVTSLHLQSWNANTPIIITLLYVTGISSSSIYSPLTNKQSLTQSKEWQVTRET